MKATGYAFPWDYLEDPEAATRAIEVGVDAVALAATYHAARVPSPLHPTRRITDIPSSAFYLPTRAGAWWGHRLIPSTPHWLEGNDAFNVAQRELVDVGLDVYAWIVLSHHDELGYANPELVVCNAFDERYPYALCPSHDDVREYCSTLVEETLTSSECRGVVLEACGPMGLDHAGVHDKLDFANFSAIDEELLSLCFCETCRTGFGDFDVDAEDLARSVREHVGTNAPSIEEVLGEELANRVAAYRATLSSNLRRELVERTRGLQPNAVITLHTSARRWATGSFPALGDANELAGLTSVVANCWNPSTADAELRSLSELVSTRLGVGAYLRLDRGWSNEALVTATLRRYVDYGMDELHLYHLGLLTSAGLSAARSVIDQCRELTT
ncbi:MAG: hypothetical protein ACLPKZ_00060 [Acidimicrobiales bacterium]